MIQLDCAGGGSIGNIRDFPGAFVRRYSMCDHEARSILASEPSTIDGRNTCSSHGSDGSGGDGSVSSTRSSCSSSNSSFGKNNTSNCSAYINDCHLEFQFPHEEEHAEAAVVATATAFRRGFAFEGLALPGVPVQGVDGSADGCPSRSGVQHR